MQTLPLSRVRRISAERALAAPWFEKDSSCVCATSLRDSASRMSCLMSRGVDGLTCHHCAGIKRSETRGGGLGTVPEKAASVNSRRRSEQFATVVLQKVKSLPKSFKFIHHRECHCPEPSPADAAGSPSDGDGFLPKKRKSTISQMACASPGVCARVLSRKCAVCGSACDHAKRTESGAAPRSSFLVAHDHSAHDHSAHDHGAHGHGTHDHSAHGHSAHGHGAHGHSTCHSAHGHSAHGHAR